MKPEALAFEVDRIGGVAGVRLAVASALLEGLVVYAAGEDRHDAEAVAALFSPLLRKAAALAQVTGAGVPQLVRLQSGENEVLAAVVGEQVLIVVARRGANVGRVRIELHRAVEALG